MLHVIWLIMTYVMGAFPFGLLVAKTLCAVDPRVEGSRNTGATNVARLCGARYGALVLALDALKGFLPTVMAAYFSDSWLFVSLVALAAVLGHMYSCFLDGKGGKGVATTIGVFLALAPYVTLTALACTLAVITVSGFVSLGSLTFGAAMPLFLLLTGHWGLVPVSLVLGGMMYWKHRDNIQRLARGQENPWRKKT